MSADITDLLSDILGDDMPSMPAKKGAPTKRPPTPPGVKQAITEVAVETFDTDLLEMAASLDEDQPLSSLPPSKLRKAAKAVREATSDKFAKVAQKKEPLTEDDFKIAHDGLDLASALDTAAEEKALPKKPPVTQGVTSKAPTFKGKRAPAAAASGTTEEDEREKTIKSLAIPMPTFTSKDLAKTMDIRNFATLVTLETARWHAKVKDRKASNDAAKANDADEAAFDTRKHLLVGADELLRRIHKALDEARAKHYEMTLPWTTKGVNDVGRRTGARLLPNTLFFEYTQEMAKWKTEMKQALDAFVPEYPNLIQLAKKKLGKRFDAGEYPPASDIGRHFGLSFDFQPIPEGKDFKGLPDQQIEALARTVNNKAQQMMENAMQEVWTRLYQAVSHMAERLGSPDKAFHYTMVDNVREVTRLLKHLNVTQDVNVEKIRKMLDKYVTPHDAKELRDNSTLRTQVAGYAQSIVQAMNKLGGAKKT